MQNENLEGILFLVLVFGAITNGALLPSKSLSLQEIHLVRCLTYISHRYFASGRTLVMSSPSEYRYVQLELTAEVHRTSIWPAVVSVDGNIIKPNKTNFIDKDGSYIVLILDGNIKSFKAEIVGLAEGRGYEFTRFWNSETRFVVAGTNEFSMSQQTDILNHFSKFRICNCIIVNQEHYEKYKGYNSSINVNDLGAAM